ncbi:replication protein P [Plesiomonas shigelloides]|uniref:replication protein P n=1 Tax=Plesiomonas shigelloides TaxID=703 RepID=UPI0015A6B21F
MLDAFTREITRILTDGKVKTKQIEHALIQAPLRKYYPYPVPRDWLEVCLEPQVNGLPDVESVMACFHRYSTDRLLYDSPERYPWPHPVMYWIVLEMRTAMKNRNLSETALIQLAKRQLKTAGLGEKIPAPVARIMDNRRPPAPVRRFETSTSQMTGLAFRKAIQEKLSKVRANQ